MLKKCGSVSAGKRPAIDAGADRPNSRRRPLFHLVANKGRHQIRTRPVSSNLREDRIERFPILLPPSLPLPSSYRFAPTMRGPWIQDADNGAVSYKCNSCDFVTRDVKTREAHVFRHLNLTRYTCSVCHRKHQHSWTAKNHMAQVGSSYGVV